MLTQEEDMEIAALDVRGWTVSAIARHTGRDRKTVKAYLKGQAKRRRRAPSVLEPYRDYLAARFTDDPHVLGSVLFREVGALGFDRSYSTLTRELRALELRPAVSAAGVAVSMSRPRSTTRPARSCSSTGWSSRKRRGGSRLTC